MTLDGQGVPTINAPTAALTPGAVSPIIRIQLRDANDQTDVVDVQDLQGGKNPRGLVLNSTDTRAYVMNLVSRDVSVGGIPRRASAQPAHRASPASPRRALPPPGSLARRPARKGAVQHGIGPAGTQENALAPAGRMSDFGWGACYNCHPKGLADGVTWMFPDGPRQTISMESTFPPAAAGEPEPGAR